MMRKVKYFTTFVLMLVCSFIGQAQNRLYGDVNEDGEVNIADVNAVINVILGGGPSNGHEYVDLGLPSGTLWATCNIGASSPEEFGDFFAWGETTPKNYYNWDNYKWCEGSYNMLTKYCTEPSHGYNGFTDGKTELDPEDDAAYVNWGAQWRIPTSDQIDELIHKCSWTFTTRNEVNGYLFTGPNGNTLFLPAAGRRYTESPSSEVYSCFYWSSTLWYYPESALSLFFHSTLKTVAANDRHTGLPVRAVRVSTN